MKKKILVLFGGVSSEHDVSLVSAASVINHIPADKYGVVKMGITKSGEFLVYRGPAERIEDGSWVNDTANTEKAVISPDRSDHGIIYTGSGDVEYIDTVFPVLHGKNGEDGTMQGLLEISGIPYVGCDTVSSACSMDKAITNALADYHGIAQAKWVSFGRYEFDENADSLLENAAAKLGFPVFVKPANAGSSVGISKASDMAQLKKACEVAFAQDKKTVIESAVTGQEVECAVMGNDSPVASTVGEIAPVSEFYDYEAKYVTGSTELFIPARISEEKIRQVREQAVRIYKALGCRGLSRVDFFVRRDDGEVLFNEINTMPGFTSISMFPKLFAACGVEYGELIEKLIEFASETK